MVYAARESGKSKLWRSLLKRYLRQNSIRISIVVAWVLLLVYSVNFIFTADLVETFLLLILYAAVFSLLTGYASQTFREGSLLLSIVRLHGSIARRIVTRTNPTKTQIQPRFESVRRSTSKFVDVSTTVFPPISEFWFDKLRNSIDVFFYAAGMVLLSEKTDYYSASERMQWEIEEMSKDEIEKLEDLYEKAQKASEDEITGHVTYFSLVELRSFLEYLANRIFRRDTTHPFWVQKYPINVVDLTNFFNHWNDILEGSENGSEFVRTARSEVDEFYSELRHRKELVSQRKWNIAMQIFIGTAMPLMIMILRRILQL